MKYLISKCLVGINCKYNGKNNYNELIYNIYKNTDSILICPEELGGLKTPRDPSEIVMEKVFTIKKIDVSKNFILGAEKSLELALKNDIKIAILKENSPSCGVNCIYDGTFSNTLIEGMGITTRLLKENGIEVYSEKDDLNEIKM